MSAYVAWVYMLVYRLETRGIRTDFIFDKSDEVGRNKIRKYESASVCSSVCSFWDHNLSFIFIFYEFNVSLMII